MPGTRKPRAVGVNHVALEVGELDAALEFYGSLFELELRGRVPGMAFIDLGDQFIALSESRRQPADEGRHFGLVVDDREAVRDRLAERGLAAGEPGGHLEFRDPWGNAVEVVDYAEVQFTKPAGVLRGMGLEHLRKTDAALDELRRKNLA